MNKKKIIKIVSIIFLGIIILISLTTVFIGNYFVTYAIARNGDGGDREVESTIITTEENISEIEKNKKIADESAIKWSEKIDKVKVSVTANDGITLKGTEYLADKKSNKWAIVLHGYHSTPESVLSIGEEFSKKGYNVLIPSMRACADSEGKYIGMGWLDKDDLKCWINILIEENNNAEIVLHGSSMGGATVLMASGDKLPNNIKAIIEDSGYTSVWDIFASEAKARFNLPSFPILDMFRIVANVRAHYDIKEASALEQVKKSNIPILFIHGDKDDFVPEYMCEELYEAANCNKKKLIIKGAGHTESKYKDPETYYTTIFNFIENI